MQFADVDLAPGDILFMPAGWWHCVHGSCDEAQGSCGGVSMAANWYFEPPADIR